MKQNLITVKHYKNYTCSINRNKLKRWINEYINLIDYSIPKYYNKLTIKKAKELIKSNKYNKCLLIKVICLAIYSIFKDSKYKVTKRELAEFFGISVSAIRERRN